MLDINRMTSIQAIIKCAALKSSQNHHSWNAESYESQQDTLHNHDKLALEQSEHRLTVCAITSNIQSVDKLVIIQDRAHILTDK